MNASIPIRPALSGKFARAVLAIPFLAAAFGTANAQPGPQPSRMTNSALAFGPARIMSAPENAIYADAAIQAELELTDAQKATLKRIPEEVALPVPEGDATAAARPPKKSERTRDGSAIKLPL